MYYNDHENSLCLRLIDYPVGSTEPRHVHAGTHATTVLKGWAIIDGLTLGPLDLVLGPGGEPHGPLHYPDGCKLLSAFQGSYDHSEVTQISEHKQYRLVQSGQIPWTEAQGRQEKTLVDNVAGRLRVQVVRFPAGGGAAAETRPEVQAGLVFEGSAVIGGETLGAWDLFYIPSGTPHGPISFPQGATLLALTLH